MSSNIPNDYFPESDDYIYFLSTLICSIAVNLLSIIQFRNLYSDLFTEERKSVSHRVVIPKVTPLYKSVNIMTWFCVFCYAITSILEVIKQGPSGNCKTEFYIVMVFFNWSKASLFSVYLLRLQSTYGGSRYSYPKPVIYTLICIQWIFGIVLPIILNTHSEIFVYDEDGFPDPCWGVFVHWNVVWLCSWDFTMNFGCLIAFIIPLYRTLNDINDKGPNLDNEVVTVGRLNMKRIAIKVTILTATASTTTIVALAAFTVFTFAHIFPFDWVINSICVVLMSPYYPDNKYFDRIFKGRICCCDREDKEVDEVQSVSDVAAVAAVPVSTVETQKQDCGV